MKVVVVKCDDAGNIDISDLRAKAEQNSKSYTQDAFLSKLITTSDSLYDRIAAFMVTYPSTHGVFESTIKECCHIIHTVGGMVFMDGANMNAQVAFTSPGECGADVCHLNLHKTCSIVIASLASSASDDVRQVLHSSRRWWTRHGTRLRR